MKTAPTNKKVREIINMVREGRLVPKPEFQRRLVWRIEDKNHFLDSVIRGYPFPEIYLADGEVDLETGLGTQLLVDGLQRVSTIVQYFNGDPDLKLTSIPPYRLLDDKQKAEFLQYDIAVRDLGNISREEIVEVFRRINATSYSLTDIEINNAVYRGELKEFAEKVAGDPFFAENNVFNALDYRRMGDLRFALLLIVTVLNGYSNRDDLFREYLDRFNDDFPHKEEIDENFRRVFDFISECGFRSRSRVWRKADLFTMFVETYIAIIHDNINLQPSVVVDTIEAFYMSIEPGVVEGTSLPALYYKAALQASNDRVNRIRRGLIIAGLLRGINEREIFLNLYSRGVVDMLGISR